MSDEHKADEQQDTDPVVIATRAAQGAAGAALNKLCKWRSFFVGWIMGTKVNDAPGVRGMRDLIDFRLVTRAELSALTALLIEKGVFTHKEWFDQVRIEAEELCKIHEETYPGYHATDTGLSIDPAKAAETNKRIGMPW